MQRIVVTGGAGFIGSAVCRFLIQNTDDDVQVYNVDALTYAASSATVAPLEQSPRYHFYRQDVTEGDALEALLAQIKPTAVLHLAAETHVDRSIDSARAFVQTNILGTFSLLEATRAYWQTLSPSLQNQFRFVQVSTDEVYGTLGETGAFTVDSPVAPNSPYAASKASADHLVRAWHQTYGLPTLVTRCTNNYGPYQFPEKLVPLIILNALHHRPLPVYGQGLQRRSWLHVDDHAAALWATLQRGQPGHVYHLGHAHDVTNHTMVEALCSLLDQRHPLPDGASYRRFIQFVADRPGHDYRYALARGPAEEALQLPAERPLAQGLAETVDWYLANPGWWQPLYHRLSPVRWLTQASSSSSFSSASAVVTWVDAEVSVP